MTTHPELPFSSLEVLSRLEQLIGQRNAARPDGSYTTKLLVAGLPKLAAKLLEETQELVDAAGESGEPGKAHAVYEAGDLIYHLLVLLAWRGISLAEIAEELARREGIGGLVEKQSRGARGT
jgi:phosphoribosyl-ATP pyrophosphohydrolase